MSIECVSSNLCSDIRCAVCGQGFLLYGDKRSASANRAVQAAVQKALRQHHHGTCHHPQDAFEVICTGEAIA